MYNCNNDEEIRRIIERDTRRCARFAVGPTGPRGATHTLNSESKN